MVVSPFSFTAGSGTPILWRFGGGVQSVIAVVVIPFKMKHMQGLSEGLRRLIAAFLLMVIVATRGWKKKTVSKETSKYNALCLILEVHQKSRASSRCCLSSGFVSSSSL